jgi:hypothetical protein
MTYGYIRVSTDKQTVENQRFEIGNFCGKNELVAGKWIEETISGTKEPSKRQLGILLGEVQRGDLIICLELSRLGRSLFMIMSVLNEMMTKEVRIWNRSGMNFFNKVNTSTPTETKAAGTTSTNTETPSEDATIAATPSFADGSRVGLSFSGMSEDGNIGFKLDINSNAATLVVGDQAKVWGKIGWLTAEFGKIHVDDLRSSIGDWGNRDIGAKGEDDVLDRFNPTLGMTMELRPIEGLFIGAAVNSSATVSTAASTTYTKVETYTDDSGTPGTSYYTKTVTKAGTTSSSTMEDTLKAINVGAGYTIKYVALVKAAYFGSALDDYYGKLEFGAKLPMYASDKARAKAFKGDSGYYTAKDGSYSFTSDGHYFDFCAGLSGSADKLSYKGHVYTQFAAIEKKFEADAYTSTPIIGLDTGVEYDRRIYSRRHSKV